MKNVEPFTGLVYNQKKVGDLSTVVAPPYDVISPEEQDLLYQKNEYNIVRLILNKEEPEDTPRHNKYTRASAFLKEWTHQQILRKDPEPAFYYYVQDFSVSSGETFQRQGFLGLLELREFEDKKILPHEYTLIKPRKDRVKLMTQCKAHLSPIFVLYPASGNAIESMIKPMLKKLPFLDCFDKNRVQHRAWKINDVRLINRIQRLLSKKTFIIADGHHRYTASLEVRNQIRKRQRKPAPSGQPYDYTLSYFCSMNNPGLKILPIHRMLHNIPGFSPVELLEKVKPFFQITFVEFKKNQLSSGLKEVKRRMQDSQEKGDIAFGLYFPDKKRFVLLRGKYASIKRALINKGIPYQFFKLDVVTLHRLILEDILGITKEAQEKQYNLRYINGILDLIPILKKNDYQAIFLLNPLPLPILKSIIKTGLCLPQKTTYFYPKLLSGIVIHTFDK